VRRVMRFLGFAGLEVLSIVLWCQGAPWFIVLVPPALWVIIWLLGPRPSERG